jgi:hypothetical protein
MKGKILEHSLTRQAYASGETRSNYHRKGINNPIHNRRVQVFVYLLPQNKCFRRDASQTKC